MKENIKLNTNNKGTLVCVQDNEWKTVKITVSEIPFFSIFFFLSVFCPYPASVHGIVVSFIAVGVNLDSPVFPVLFSGYIDRIRFACERGPETAQNLTREYGRIRLGLMLRDALGSGEVLKR